MWLRASCTASNKWTFGFSAAALCALGAGCEDAGERLDGVAHRSDAGAPDAAGASVGAGGAHPSAGGRASSAAGLGIPPNRQNATGGSAAAPDIRGIGLGSDAGADGGCEGLPVIDRARVFAAPGAAEQLVGGKIAGSNTSAMNDFVELGVIAAPPEDGQWLELRLENTTPYRYVKYYAPPGSYGAVAEVEFYSGEVKLDGEGFGTAGSFESQGTTFDLALDADTASFFQGPLPNDAYVGIDIGAGYVSASPSFSPAPGDYDTAPTVALEAEPGAAVYFTVDGADPVTSGALYSEPFALAPGATLVRAAAVRDCGLPSESVTAVYRVGEVTPEPEGRPGSSTIASSMHIGNSLTDTIVDHLAPLALSGGVQLDFNRYTIPGAGTWLYADSPSGGFGVENVQQALRSRAFDHLSMQPYPNLPCQITASDGGPDSDSAYIDQAWDDARTQNPNVQLWVYQQWPEPDDFTNCMSGGDWLRSDWQPPAPATWDDAVMNELAYHEALVSELMRLNPDAPRPYIVPGGLGLLRLKQAVEAGEVPGFDDFFAQIFLDGGTDVHLTRPGQYFVTLVFYASMFQRDPSTTANDPRYGVTDEQAAAMQAIAWETVTSYASSGVPR